MFGLCSIWPGRAQAVLALLPAVVPEDELLVDDLAAVSDDDLLSEAPLAELPDGLPEAESATLRLLLFLKSVSYQPLPFRRKPAAEIRRCKVAFPQAGQSLNGSSLMRCSFSSSWPQELQRYS